MHLGIYVIHMIGKPFVTRNMTSLANCITYVIIAPLGAAFVALQAHAACHWEAVSWSCTQKFPFFFIRFSSRGIKVSVILSCQFFFHGDPCGRILFPAEYILTPSGE